MSKAVSTISEKYLLDALERVARNPAGYSVLYINISKLKPKNRHPEFVKILAKLFDSVVGDTKGTMFILANGDFAILGKDITHEIIDEAMKKLRAGLSADPVLHSKDSKEFFDIYDFPEDLTTFHNYVEDLVANAVNLPANDVDFKRPVTVSEIDELINRLDEIDVAEIVKRQSILRILGGGKFDVIFQEFFVAVKDLSRQFDSSLDLVANRWLFLYLTQTLDKKTMEAFFSSDIENWPKQISLNLNLSSVFSREFVNFAKNFVRSEQKIIVEIQLMDVFNNLPLYFQAKEILHRGGHKLLLDAVSPSALKMLNIQTVAPDMIKVFWEPLLEYEPDNEDLKNAINHIGRENVILAKCENEQSIKWGVKYGITAFQGPYIDNLEVALMRNKCPFAKECGSQNCLKRKRLLRGKFRDECKNKNILEELLGQGV